MEVSFTYHEICLFKVYNSVVLSTFTGSCSCQHCLIPVYSTTPKISPIHISSHLQAPAQPLAATNPLPVSSWTCLFWTFCINGIAHRVAFRVWLLSLSIVCSSCSECPGFTPFHGHVIFQCVDGPHFVCARIC